MSLPTPIWSLAEGGDNPLFHLGVQGNHPQLAVLAETAGDGTAESGADVLRDHIQILGREGRRWYERPGEPAGRHGTALQPGGNRRLRQHPAEVNTDNLAGKHNRRLAEVVELLDVLRQLRNNLDPLSVMQTHLSEVIRSHAYELLGRAEVIQLVENLKRTAPEVVEFSTSWMTAARPNNS